MSVNVFDAKAGIQEMTARDEGLDEPAQEQCKGNHPEGGKCCEMLTAEMNHCPVCNRFTVFSYSKIWKSLYCDEDNPTPRAVRAAYFKAIDGDKKAPKTELGKRLLAGVGRDRFNREITRFSSQADLIRWRKIEKTMTYTEIQAVFDYWWKWRGRDKQGKPIKKRGHGLLYCVLKGCEKQIRERPVQAEQESVFEGLGE
jgi:hypothetical protein